MTDGAFVFDELDKVHERQNITLLVEGGQRTQDKDGRVIGGADHWARMWAVARSIPYATEAADWHYLKHPEADIRQNRNGTKYDRNAGPRRNQLMIDKYRPTRLIAFKGGAGTRNMIIAARRAGLDIVVVRPSEGTPLFDGVPA
ncbi:hypothetical protein MesoLjLc_51590 [Mesorhizobium sp. L-8-10]|nr:hypothetical protein MesoLjLc_51590 [Mesorhizobium sp. L-8-10]